jgi:uncharacterized protein YkwD
MDYSMEEDIIEYIFRKIKHLIVPSEGNNYKSKFLQSNILLYFVILLLVLKITTVLVTINFPQNIFFADITKLTLENFANQTRQSLGLPALNGNQKLDEAARLKAENMVQNQYFNHTSPSGITPWFWFLKAGYKYKYAGENLAIGFFDSKEVYNAWLNSPSHKANIVNPKYTEVGTAVLGGFGQNNAIVVVQEFGTQLPAVTTAKNNNPKPATVQPTKSTVKTTEPAPVDNIQTPVADINKKVLSQSTESKISIEFPNANTINNLSSKLLNFVLYSYDKLLQNIIYGVSLIVIGILLTFIFFNFNIYPVESRGINFKKELVFRSVLIIVLLSAAAFLDSEIIISFIPHQIII